jgi:hypothetical protein
MDKALSEVSFGKGGRDEQRKGTSPVPSVHGLNRARTKERGKTRAPGGKRQSGSPKAGNSFKRKPCKAQGAKEAEEPSRRTLGSQPPV